MAKTLAQVRTLTRGYLDEASSTATDWSDSELNILINQRYHKVVTAVIAVFEDYYLTTDLANTTADQEEYSSSDGLPTDIFKIRRVEVNYDTTNANNAPLRALPLHNIDAVRRDLAYTNASLGVGVYSNVYYYTYGHSSSLKIGIIPIPTRTATDAIKIWYIKQVADLSSDASTLDIPYVDRYWGLIAEGATADALRFGQQSSDEADKFDGKFDRGIALMQEELEDKQAEESKYVLDVSGDPLDFTAT